MENLNKEILGSEIAEENGLTKVQGRKIVEDVFGKIEKALVNGDKVLIYGFGKFETKKREARKGHNPATGMEMDIPASRSASFKPAKALKDAVKNS